MAKENIEISFDREHHIISLSKSGKKVKFSMDFEFPNGDVVVDYGFDGSVVGIEIFNALEYLPMLKNIGVKEKIRGELNINYGRNWVQISFLITSPKLKNPITNSIISPYNRKIILEH